MNNFKSALFFVAILTFSLFAKQKLDGIIAVVGDSAILKSELDAYVYMKLSQDKSEEKPDSLAMNMIRRSALDEMIDGKVMLVHAEKDTNISVTKAEVESELESRINFIIKRNNLTLEQLDTVLQKEQGITLAKFKIEIKNQIKQELLQQKLQYFYVASEKLSNSDISTFYEEYKDSIPAAGPSLLLNHLSFSLVPSKEIREKAYAKISKIKEILNGGADFAETAKQFSEDPGASSGGDLGFISKGSISELIFEEKIFSLKPGEISEPFETKIGFHIVNVLARKGQSVHVKQIFVAVSPDEVKKKQITALFDSIAATSPNESNFSDAIIQHSNDPLLKSKKGLLPWNTIATLDDEIKNSFDTLAVGSISKVIANEKSISLYRIKAVDENRKVTLSDDWNTIAQIAKRIYEQKKMVELVAKWRKTMYIEKRL